TPCASVFPYAGAASPSWLMNVTVASATGLPLYVTVTLTGLVGRRFVGRLLPEHPASSKTTTKTGTNRLMARIEFSASTVGNLDRLHRPCIGGIVIGGYDRLPTNDGAYGERYGRVSMAAA